MKRVINMLAEVLSLPYSDAFFEGDPFTDAVEKSGILDVRKADGDSLHRLSEGMREQGVWAAEYLNRRVGIRSLAELQNQWAYVFRADDLFSCLKRHDAFKSGQALLNQYYVENLMRLSEVMLTTRNGRAVLRPWCALPDSLFAAEGFLHETPREEGSFEPRRIELWNSLLRALPEDLFISSYAADQLGDSEKRGWCCDSLPILKRFGTTVDIADVLMDKVLDAGMGETHLHAGASRVFGLMWEYAMTAALRGERALERNRYPLPYKGEVVEKKMAELHLEAAVVRLILAAYLGDRADSLMAFLHSDVIAPQYREAFLNGVDEIRCKGKPDDKLAQGVIPGLPIFEDGVSMDIWQWLALPEDQRNSNIQLAEMCLQCHAFQHVRKRPGDAAFTALFLYYLRLRTKAYRFRVEDSKNKGLSYFQKYYNLSADAGAMDRGVHIGELIYTATLDKRVVKTEFRFSPPPAHGATMDALTANTERKLKKGIEIFIRQHLRILALRHGERSRAGDDLGKRFNEKWRMALDAIYAGDRGVLKNLLDCIDVSTDDIPRHRLGIVYHLIKTGERGENPACFAKAKRAISEKEKRTCFSFGKTRFSYEAAIRAISNVRDLCPAVSRLIVGIDAASLEIGTDPWVFAPAFRLAKQRNAMLGGGGVPYDAKQLLGASYHVGEDFHHPISGLRHVDEAIEYLSLRSGDRIGHGLALGIDIERWYRANGLILMPRMEWLENNLWLWHILPQVPELSGFSDYLRFIEDQIICHAKHIYGIVDGITPEALYQAYHDKALDAEELMWKCREEMRKCDDRTDCNDSAEDCDLFPCYHNSNGDKPCTWTEKWLALSYHCGVYKQRMQEVIPVSCTPEQMKLAMLAQAFMRKKVADRGVIIEANPSSNAVIGEMDGVLSHPIQRFRDEGEHRVMTSVNTDDPSVFSATIANEYSLIYYAMRYHGAAVEEALEQVDELRGIGMKSSFIREVTTVDQMLADYEHILAAIRY